MSYLASKDILYLFNKRYTLELKNKKLRIYYEGEKTDEVPFFRLTAIVLNYHIPLQPKILQYTFEHNISVIFVDGHFKFMGSVKHPESKNIFLRQAHYRSRENPDFALDFTKRIIEGKIRNSASVIGQRKRDLEPTLHQIREAESVEEVRGIEGAYANWYFQQFGACIKKEDFQWHGRRKRPARDEVNALLSWGYTLLGIEIQTFCEIIGLDPYLGFMHQEYYGRPSLVCDLQEEFRPWVVDKFVLRLINLGIIRKEHFKENNGQYRLTSEGYRIFQQEWLYKIKADKRYRVLFKTELAVRGVIETQVRRVSKALTGEHEYNAYIV